MQNAPREHSAILSTCIKEHSAILPTCIKLPCVFKTYVLSIFEWPLKTGFTVYNRPSDFIIYSFMEDSICLKSVKQSQFVIFFRLKSALKSVLQLTRSICMGKI